MKGDLPKPGAPDRLSTLEEIRWATGTSPERVLELSLRRSLLHLLFHGEASDCAGLSVDDLEYILQLGESEGMQVD